MAFGVESLFEGAHVLILFEVHSFVREEHFQIVEFEPHFELELNRIGEYCSFGMIIEMEL